MPPRHPAAVSASSACASGQWHWAGNWTSSATIAAFGCRRRFRLPPRQRDRAVDVRVLLVDDHAIVREGYRTLLEKHNGLRVVGEASNAALAYQRYKETRPDVVVMDISMPGRGGIDAIEHIRGLDA